MKQRVKSEGKTPAIIGDPIQDTDNYAIRFGWSAFWELPQQERARVVATFQVEDEIQFVSSNWTQYGPDGTRAVAESAEEAPAKDDDIFGE